MSCWSLLVARILNWCACWPSNYTSSIADRNLAQKGIDAAARAIVSIVETVSHLHVDLPRIGIMSAAESRAVVQKKAPVGEVQGGGRQRQVLTQSLAKGKIE